VWNEYVARGDFYERRGTYKGEKLSGKSYMAWWFVNVGIIVGVLGKRYHILLSLYRMYCLGVPAA
jgi:hypothetical protein